MIRWKGLIAFVVLLAVLVGLGLWVLPYGIKKSIEYAGSRATGATVDVADVALNYSPFAIIITGLEVADPEQLSHNMVSMDEAAVSIGLMKLLMHQLVIHDLRIDNLALNTPRDVPGKLVGGESKKKAEEKKPSEPSMLDQGLSALGKTLPSASDILTREPLLIDKAQEQLTSTYAEQQQKWPELVKQLPNEKTLKSYEARIKELVEGDVKSLDDFQRRVNELKKIKKDLQQDKKVLVQAKDELKKDQAQLRSELSALKKAPAEDFNRIKNKYTLDQQGAGQYAALVFGPEIGSYIQQAIGWYDKIAPVVENLQQQSEEEKPPARGEGRIIRFPENPPRPDFIIEKAVFAMQLPIGTLRGKASDITHQQKLINRPTRIEIASRELQGIALLDTDITLDYRGEEGINSAKFIVEGYQIDEQPLVKSDDINITLAKASMQANGELQLIGGQVSGGWKSLFNQVQFTSQANDALIAEIGKAFETIHDFNLDVGVLGSLNDVKLEIGSNIDSRLGKAFQKRLEARYKKLERDLQNKLQGQLAGYLKDAGVAEADMVQQQAFLDDMDAQLQKMLDAEVKNYTDKHQKKLEDKLKKELDKLF